MRERKEIEMPETGQTQEALDAAAGSLPRRLDVSPQIVHGALAGLLGASLVAVLFFVLDLLRGEPLWTPHALGSALFLGGAPSEPVSAVLVLGYTLAHAGVFLAFGLLAALAQSVLPWRPALARAFVTGLSLFVVFEVTMFALFRGLLVEGAVGALHARWVGIANLLAATGMGGYLALLMDPERIRLQEGPGDDDAA